MHMWTSYIHRGLPCFRTPQVSVFAENPHLTQNKDIQSVAILYTIYSYLPSRLYETQMHESCN